MYIIILNNLFFFSIYVYLTFGGYRPFTNYHCAFLLEFRLKNIADILDYIQTTRSIKKVILTSKACP